MQLNRDEWSTKKVEMSYDSNVMSGRLTSPTKWTESVFAKVASIVLVLMSASVAQAQGTVASFMVFFDWGSSKMGPHALATVGQAVDAYQAHGARRITLTGHSDTSVSDVDAVAIGFARANGIKEVLVGRGIPENQIIVFSRGKRARLVQTADGVREPQNRRVEIVVQR